MVMKTLTAVILAAGESKRMRSSRPKALHLLGGGRLIDYPVRVARALGARVVLVVGRGAEDVRAAVGEAPDLAYVEQKERLGTAHALLQARGACGDGAGAVLVLPGDQPLMSEALLRALVDHHRSTAAAATLLTAEVEDPAGYGRVVREGGRRSPSSSTATRPPHSGRFARSARARTASTRDRSGPRSTAWSRRMIRASTT